MGSGRTVTAEVVGSGIRGRGRMGLDRFAVLAGGAASSVSGTVEGSATRDWYRMEKEGEF